MVLYRCYQRRMCLPHRHRHCRVPTTVGDLFAEMPLQAHTFGYTVYHDFINAASVNINLKSHVRCAQFIDGYYAHHQHETAVQKK